MADKTITCFKGFDKDWKCRDFKYEVGKTYTHDGDISLCKSGFHAVEYPLDVFVYYPPTGQIATVELGGVTDEKSDDSKRVGKSVTIKASITIPDLISAAIEYTTKRCDPVRSKHSTGDRSASSATGDRSASSATGYSSASSATGDSSASSATGYSSASSATGYSSASSATGKHAVAAAFGLSSKAKADEDGAIIVAWMDGERKRYAIGYVGENGIARDVFYRADNNGNLVPA